MQGAITPPKEDLPPSDPFASDQGITVTSSAPPTYQPSDATENKPKPRIPLMGIIIGIVVFLLMGSGVLAYMVTYQDFSIGQPKLEKTIAHTVQLAPFTPKTTEFLLERNVLAHAKVTRQKFSASIAAQSDDFMSTLGMSQIDMEIKGAIDYTDINNPLVSADISITKDFQMSIKKPNKMVYFQITKVPTLITSAMGLDYDTFIAPFLNTWVSYDTTQLDTEARSILNKERTDSVITPSSTDKLMESTAYKNFLKNMTITKETLDDGTAAYRLKGEVPPELIELVMEETAKSSGSASDVDRYLYESNRTSFADVFQKFSLDITLEASTYLTKKTAITMVIMPETGGEPVRVVIAFTADAYGEPVVVEVPSASVPLEDFILQLQQTFMGPSMGGGTETSATSFSYQ